MQITVRALAAASAFQSLERAGLMVLVDGRRSDISVDLPWPDQRADEFLRRAAASMIEFDLNPWMVFSKQEISAARFLRLRCRKVVSDSTTDFERTRQEIDGLPWVGEDPDRRFRVPNRLFLSRLDLRPNQIAGVGEWSAEYVAAAGIGAGLLEDGLSGLAAMPVYHTKSGRPLDRYVQLYSESILPPRIIDTASLAIGSTRLPSRSTLSLTSEEKGYHAWGCLCYSAEALARAKDFNRTGERMVSFEFPEWIVTQRVRGRYDARHLRGWAFEPILEEGTEAFHVHEQLWKSFYAVLEECSVHTIHLERPWLRPTTRSSGRAH
jgi:hypothetical protein